MYTDWLWGLLFNADRDETHSGPDRELTATCASILGILSKNKTRICVWFIFMQNLRDNNLRYAIIAKAITKNHQF